MKIVAHPEVEHAVPVARTGEPVRAGVPLPRGWCRDAAGLTLTGEGTSRGLRLQARALDRWSDGSVRWVLLDFLADHDGTPVPRAYELEVTPDALPQSGAIGTIDPGGGVVVDTGAARFCLRPGEAFPFAAVHVGGEPAIDVQRTGVTVEDGPGRICDLRSVRVTLEESGSIRAVVLVEGHVSATDGARLLDVVARLHFVAGSATVRVVVTVANPRRARHPGGLWELGDAGSVPIRDVSFVVALPGTPAPDSIALRCSIEPGQPSAPVGAPLEIYQASSGGDNWNSANHVNRQGLVPLPFQGFRLRAAGTEQGGLRASPIVHLACGRRELAVSLPLFWQNFPKTIEANDGGAVTLRLFPRQHQDGHDIQGGEQKTHVFFVAFGHDGVTARPLEWTRAPLVARLDPDAYSASGAVPYLDTAASEAGGYRELVRAAVEGPDSFDRKRDVIDEFGWRHFGDLYADHEGVFYAGPSPVMSHYNNQYDAVAGCAYQFMRSGDVRWWRLFSQMAAHVADIDVYHTDRDKPAYNRGLFWHTAHYVDAGLSTHRSFPRAPGVHGGGPSPEHNYSTGLLLHYFLTGDPISRDVAAGLAGWVVAMDEGTRTPFRILAGGETGIASATASPLYHGPGRGPGNSINVLLNGFRLTGNAAFLRKAEALIRRCIHPADDIAGRGLLDAERRWSYTVFLHALGRYLDDKAERGELDAMYAYARASLLAYARWMAERERPYLDNPAALEFPTETWAAQEMWKNEVFLFAAKHAGEDERPRFLERAGFFFQYSLGTLASMPTRALTRPLVLLLSHGFMQQYMSLNPKAITAPAPPGNVEFGAPRRFVPQKERAKRRLIALIGLALAGLAAAAWRMSMSGAS